MIKDLKNKEMLEKISGKIGYNFCDSNLLHLAFTHSSSGKEENNERLEFLGDAVLNMVMAEHLFNIFSNEREGVLAKKRAFLISKEVLFQVSQELGLGELLLMSKGEEKTGGRGRVSNLENCMEALIGATYLDGGIEAAKAVILKIWSEYLQETYLFKMTQQRLDPKSYVQEWCQAKGLTPKYCTLKTSGSAHEPEFLLSLQVSGYDEVTDIDGNKKNGYKKLAAKFIELNC